MANIPKRSDVVNRLAKEEQASVNAAVDALVSALNAATSLPVVVPMETLGPTQTVRLLVQQKLEEAGWRVRRHDQANNTDYEVS